ncbi:hypothetical protein GOODEAATRI_004003, partial [Goodea atripinnis]
SPVLFSHVLIKWCLLFTPCFISVCNFVFDLIGCKQLSLFSVFQEFLLSEDYNKMTPALTYQAHQGRVAVVLFVLEMEWLLSTGQDRNFTWHCSESGQQLGTYRTAAWVSGLQYPSTLSLSCCCLVYLQVSAPSEAARRTFKPSSLAHGVLTSRKGLEFL